MRINGSGCKAVLFSCFFELQKGQMGQEIMRPKTFMIDKIADAGSASKKLKDGMNEKTGKFTDTEVEFIPSEIAVLKELFDIKAKKGFPFGDADAVVKLDKLFKGKK